MSFKPNDKVVCVMEGWEGEAEGYRNIGPLPTKGPVYVVQAVGLASDKRGISLVGSTSIYIATNTEVGFNNTHFRLVSEVGHPAIQVKEEQPA